MQHANQENFIMPKTSTSLVQNKTLQLKKSICDELLLDQVEHTLTNLPLESFKDQDR